jgi:hypothetical protein
MMKQGLSEVIVGGRDWLMLWRIRWLPPAGRLETWATVPGIHRTATAADGETDFQLACPSVLEH